LGLALAESFGFATHLPRAAHFGGAQRVRQPAGVGLDPFSRRVAYALPSPGGRAVSRLAVLCVAAVLPPAITGCATALNLEAPTPAVYGGVALDLAVGPGSLKAAAQPTQPPEQYYFSPPGNVLLGIMALLDLPFSAAADTATLPVTLMAALKKLHDGATQASAGGGGASAPNGASPAGAASAP
jgi:uncharacterized protein YceK